VYPRAMALTPKRRAFVEAYLSGSAERFVDGVVRNSYLNATQAARQAGYAHPGAEGHRLLKDAEIGAAIDERMRDMEIRTEQIIAREFDVATAGIGDFAEVLEQANAPRMARKAKELGIDHLIKKIKDTPNGIEFELYDAHQARELLGRRLKLWDGEDQKFDMSKVPPILFNVMSATPAEILETLDQLRKQREGE